jgi:glucokinase
MAHALLDRADGDPARITGPLVTAVAAEGDVACRELFQEIGEWLGVGIANLVAAYDPGRIVIGGGVSEAGALLLDPALQAFRRNLTGRGYRPEAQLVLAALGNQAGLVGAADLARPFARRPYRARYRREQARKRA